LDVARANDGGSVPAASNARLKPHPLPTDLIRFVRREQARTKTPGVALGILYRGRAYVAGFGVTNVASPSPADHETLFQVGSTGKTFTTTAIMRLVERGELDLDAPVRRYVRELELRDAEAARRVTLRHLLTHTGGWAGDLFEDTGRGADALAEVVRRMRSVPQLTPLGSTWHYNNAGFYLAGRVIEKVTGSSFEAAIEELVLDPLGMTRSFYFTEQLLSHHVAIGHVAKGSRQIPQPWWGMRSVAPAGGLVSDVLDQLRWAWFHMGDGRAPNGERLLKRSTLRMMQRPQAPAGGLAEWVGLSWLLDDVDGTRLVSHGGTTIGQLSTFTMVPSKALAVTTLTNSTSGRAFNRVVVARVLERYAGLRRTPPAPVTVTPAELAAYRGRYVDGFKRLEVALEPARGVLRGRMAALGDDEEGPLPTVRLALYDRDRAVHVDEVYPGLKADFLRNGSGRVAWMRLGGRLYRRVSSRADSTQRR
jgi:CubicO group peptidase (beta-lactamase class C family)